MLSWCACTVKAADIVTIFGSPTYERLQWVISGKFTRNQATGGLQVHSSHLIQPKTTGSERLEAETGLTYSKITRSGF
jgi:hypothetical protein